MKALLLFLGFAVCVSAYAEKDPEITDDSQIRTFLASPGVQNFNYPDPVGWKSYRKYIQLGKKMPDGSCQYNFESVVPSNQPFVKKEIAVDRANCKSLMLEGVPGDATVNQWKQIQDVMHRGAVVEKKESGKRIEIRKDSTSSPTIKLNKTAEVTDLTAADPSVSTNAATGAFNSGGPTYNPRYDIQYTDGNNPVMKQGLVGIVTGLADLLKLLGLQIGQDGILAAETGVSQSY
ncbi:hypothetical protein [Burkholderia perseverans]|uniref:hypothetical protein n=1 Tax=Burkholderia perseverans TaxID=2615214 RepID=UPI001FED3035|nr:hypothetical protein [Burkholderia perseverans]